LNPDLDPKPWFWYINKYSEVKKYIFLKFVESSISRKDPGGSVVDPYSFFPDPDPDPEFDVGYQYGSGSNTDPGL
jgi:hypothetical protein